MISPPTARTIPIAPLVFWRMSQEPEAVASLCASASCYRDSEDIGIVPVVIPELDLRNVQRQVLGADLMERANHAALKDAPKSLNRVRMDCADDIFASGVVEHGVRE